MAAASSASGAAALPRGASARPAIGRAARADLIAASASPVPTADAARGLRTAWGVCGFLGILAQAIGRLAPIAMQPILQRDITMLQWGLYGGTMAFFAYTEGYKAFQCKFSPLVVQRAMTLSTRSPPPPLLHSALAPFYSMGLFHASKKRKMVSWSISLGVACIIGLVKRLPYPWRSVVDAGVCTGLLWGGTSIGVIYLRALAGKSPGVDPELPKEGK
eukprot:CAMPEP_0185508196 /NCGR_PEP_ID=MMETSP1366-20130426/43929_1 /TAXON_ID=38817 /ORGANISM="Gephyrocapsa oceanica, Strain RCC1303" /LENGTH=217 /DNA_ID=CAMNT_0028118529 /DNA_START=1 /DNA_END=654 /DNA_ORIENTATION=+